MKPLAMTADEIADLGDAGVQALAGDGYVVHLVGDVPSVAGPAAARSDLTDRLYASTGPKAGETGKTGGPTSERRPRGGTATMTAEERLLRAIFGEKVPADGETADRDRVADRFQVLELPLREAREAFERAYLDAQLDRFEGDLSRIAAHVGMERGAFERKLRTLGLAADRDAGAEAEETPAAAQRSQREDPA